ncbi:MAG: hypothetical protein E6R10_01950 [Rhodocyclaceae bacterium]|nr:MAG: hypothetical protein E6R10_01950 [Rhodocyclaceae bacterium]
MMLESWEQVAVLSALPLLLAAIRLASLEAPRRWGGIVALKQMGRGAAFFAVLGPLLGGLMLGAMITLVMGGARSIGDGILLVLGSVVIAYLTCLMPAALTGLAAGALRPWLNTWERRLSFGACGAILTALSLQLPGNDSCLLGLFPSRMLNMLTADPVVPIASFTATTALTIWWCRAPLPEFAHSGDNWGRHA